jgi:hypothetical protein
LTLCGCALSSTPIARHIPSAANAAEFTNTFGEVYLYTSWFSGIFGDGQKEWNGLVSDNELVIGLHPATRSEFDFKVRSYPHLRSLFTDKTSLLREMAREVELTNKMTVTSETFETLSIGQYYHHKGKIDVSRSLFTFLRKEGKMEGQLPGSIYSTSGGVHFVQYLADVHSDAETNLSGTVFHAVALIPETVKPEERERLVNVMKLFIENMDLSRAPK